MLVYSICILAGAYATEVLSAIPGYGVLAALGGTALAMFAIRSLRPLACLLTGFVLMCFAGTAQVEDRPGRVLVGQTVGFTARIADFTRPDPESISFLALPVGREDLPARIRLNWPAPAITPQIGETWRLQARLRRPRGYSNPGGFDFESWLFRRKIGATGYVVDGPGTYRVHGEPAPLLSGIRRSIAGRVEQVLPADDARAVLLAISVGARHEISREQWDLYARTGTSHLMAISGLHIGLASASVFVVSWLILGAIVRRRNVIDLCAIASVAAAIAYAALSGFAVPARRASLMAVIAGSAMIMRRRIGPGALLAAPCLLIFIMSPLAILSPGFKLSFAAVAILLFIAARHYRPPPAVTGIAANRSLHWLRQILFVQMALLAGLLPLTALIFDRFSPVAPLVNLVVLPVFNFVTVPLALLGIALGGLPAGAGDAMLVLAHTSIRWVLAIVAEAGRPVLASLRLAGDPLVWALLPITYVLLPAGWPGRKIAFAAMAALALYLPPPPSNGCFRYHVLDVGQGLATVVRTRNSTLLFDTGPAYQGGSSAADLVVLPFLAHAGIRRIDRLVVSHGDLDHSGGVGAVLGGVETGQVFTGEHLNILGRAQRPCTDDIAWQADGVRFRFLHPRAGSPWKGNNASCVLEVTAGDDRLLLTGDIEAPVEILLAHRNRFEESNVVLVPHHGSRTSSRLPLVEATRPGIAIVAAGYENRWGFPKDDVVSRWEAVGAEIVNTATAGAVSQLVCAGSGAGPLNRERHRAPRYWRDPDRDPV